MKHDGCFISTVQLGGLGGRRFCSNSWVSLGTGGGGRGGGGSGMWASGETAPGGPQLVQKASLGNSSSRNLGSLNHKPFKCYVVPTIFMSPDSKQIRESTNSVPRESSHGALSFAEGVHDRGGTEGRL